MSTGSALRDVLGKLSLKALSLGLERGSRLAVTVASAPILGEARFGQLVFASTVTAMLALAADMGLALWTTRALARDHRDGNEVVRVGLVLRGAAAFPYALAVGVTALGFARGELRVAMAFLGVAALCNGGLDHFGAILRGSERFPDETRLNGVRAAITTLLGFAALAGSPSLAALAAALMVASLASFAYGAAVVFRHHPLPRHRPLDRALARLALRESFPIWVAGLLSLLYFKVDTFFVRSFAGDAELGAYGAAYKLFEGAMLLPAVVLAVTFPRLVRAQGDAAAQGPLERRLAGSLLALGMFVGALLVLGRGLLVPLIFGQGFRRAQGSLWVLALGLPLVYLNFGLTHFLVARGRERVNTALALMMLIVTVGLDVALVPRGGGPGAAAATVIAEVALTLGCLVALSMARRAAPGLKPLPAPSKTSRAAG
jgi:O-antigen/teichoic acid export membrane protein